MPCTSLRPPTPLMPLPPLPSLPLPPPPPPLPPRAPDPVAAPRAAPECMVANPEGQTRCPSTDDCSHFLSAPPLPPTAPLSLILALSVRCAALSAYPRALLPGHVLPSPAAAAAPAGSPHGALAHHSSHAVQQPAVSAVLCSAVHEQEESSSLCARWAASGSLLRGAQAPVVEVKCYARLIPGFSFQNFSPNH